MRPWLWLPSQLAHDLSPYLLPTLSRLVACQNNQWESYEWKGLHFSNRLGIAGGVDKTGACLPSWERLGAGFLEVGTVTPQAQGPNPGKIMDRDISQQALWNKMGFPNQGLKTLIKNLEKFKQRQVPLFINVGKNRWTPNEKAHEDYIQCIKETRSYADVFVINLSSPNTKGLRDLLSEEYLKTFLNEVIQQIQEMGIKQPLLLKLSPDMEDSSLKMTLDLSFDFVDGWILTNTTKQRGDNNKFPENEGGVSGRPLKEISRNVLHNSIHHLGEQKKQKLIVSVGGIMDAEEIRTRREMGADLLQFYSPLVFAGPQFFTQSLSHLRKTEV